MSLSTVLIVAASGLVLALGFMLILGLAAAHMNTISVLAMISWPLVIPVAIVVGLVADPGWWAVALTAIPLLLGLLAAARPDPETGWNFLRAGFRLGTAARADRAGDAG